WFGLTLLPVIGLVQVGSQAMADRYAYLPFIGLYIGVVWFVADIAPARPLAPAAAAFVVVVLLLAMFTRRQIEVWRDSVTLFEHALQVEPDNWLAHLQLGDAYLARG